MDESVKREFLSKFDFGDMQIRYDEETERGHVVFALVPTHMENEIQEIDGYIINCGMCHVYGGMRLQRCFRQRFRK